MKKTVLYSATVLLVWLGLADAARAYNEGGHYYTLLALFDSKADSASAERLREMKLEAFCAELPDLAQELDAISQRVRVLQSLGDNLWGLLGRCQTGMSAHMVASQYYLHGLTGTPVPQVREAAKAIVKAIDADLGKPGLAKVARRNLVCARGFAAHLYGDAYAHVRLSSERRGFFFGNPHNEMYATGLGHARDGHYPDYLYAHNMPGNQWPQWVKYAATDVVAGAGAQRVLDARQPCPGNRVAKCEEPAEKRLQALIRNKEALMTDMQALAASGNMGLGNMERATSCDSLLQAVFPADDDRPRCDMVWKRYLEKAVPVFDSLGLDATAGANARAHKSCSAWHCSGKADYDGEASASCAVEIADELRYGMNPR